MTRWKDPSYCLSSTPLLSTPARAISAYATIAHPKEIFEIRGNSMADTAGEGRIAFADWVLTLRVAIRLLAAVSEDQFGDDSRKLRIA
jgi:hypothetical protein